MCICVYVNVEAIGGLVLLCHSALFPREQDLLLHMAEDGPVASRPSSSLSLPPHCAAVPGVWELMEL